MTPKTDQELRDMGWLGLDVYIGELLTSLVSETMSIAQIITVREEIERVERMMELVS